MTRILDYEKDMTGLVCGVDEAGRGPLAGPVACAAVIMHPGIRIEGIDDSKKLSAKTRDTLYERIIASALAYSVVFVGNERIDEVNILNAVKEGMREAVLALKVVPDIVLVDAVQLELPHKTRAIVHGDSLSYSIAAASILAKVERDRLMLKLGEEYPHYGFASNKGYGTSAHINALACYGACPHHRRSFLKNFAHILPTVAEEA